MSARTRARRDMQALLQKAQQRVDCITEADARFFDRFPGRAHRARIASIAELDQNALMSGETDKAPEPGRRWFVVVRQIAPGVRLRLFSESAADADVDCMTEAEARDVFEFVAAGHPFAAQLEARLRAAVAKRGAQ